MTADIRYGGRVQVEFSGVVNTLQGKLEADCQNLSILLIDDEGRHNFEAQVTLLKEIQAGVRTLDVLKGEVDINGERTASGLTRDLAAHGRDEQGRTRLQRVIPPAPESEGDQGGDGTTTEEPVIDMTHLGRAIGVETEEQNQQ